MPMLLVSSLMLKLSRVVVIVIITNNFCLSLGSREEQIAGGLRPTTVGDCPWRRMVRVRVSVCRDGPARGRRDSETAATRTYIYRIWGQRPEHAQEPSRLSGWWHCLLTKRYRSRAGIEVAWARVGGSWIRCFKCCSMTRAIFHGTKPI